jgi:hypothetical protein
MFVTEQITIRFEDELSQLSSSSSSSSSMSTLLSNTYDQKYNRQSSSFGEEIIPALAWIETQVV